MDIKFFNVTYSLIPKTKVSFHEREEKFVNAIMHTHRLLLHPKALIFYRGPEGIMLC